LTCGISTVTTTADDVPVWRRDDIDVIAIGQFLKRYRWLIGGAALLGAVFAGLLALVMQPIFRAEAVVTPVRANSTLGRGGTQLSSQLGGLAAIAGLNIASLESGQGEEAVAVLESRHLVELFIERNGLMDLLLEDSAPDQKTLWYAVERFKESVLTIRADPIKRTTTVAIDWRDADVAAKWANSFVALANDRLRERALAESQRSIDYLNQQVEKTTVVELNRVMYNLIETEMQKLMLANARTEYAFTVVDPAVVPEEKMSPQPLIMVGLGALLGLIVGLLLAFYYLLRRKRELVRP
jgi:uncharacterized protein involved in exopolysaccharide biosynthesis